ncbi:hypothetical protein Hanom_Chr10g00877841 [Helianthus anomalus]
MFNRWYCQDHSVYVTSLYVISCEMSLIANYVICDFVWLCLIVLLFFVLCCVLLVYQSWYESFDSVFLGIFNQVKLDVEFFTRIVFWSWSQILKIHVTCSLNDIIVVLLMDCVVHCSN